MILYQLEPQQITDPTLGPYRTYGIGVYQVETHQKKRLFLLSDVFLDYPTARQFVAQCNREDLDPIHLGDVVADVLGVPHSPFSLSAD